VKELGIMSVFPISKSNPKPMMLSRSRGKLEAELLVWNCVCQKEISFAGEY